VRLGIAAPQRSAVEAGAAAFAAGGNAIDAALAAALSLTVAYPSNCALGGDLIALVRRPGGRAVVVNASGPAAAATDAAALRTAGARMPVYGAATVTVPGLIAGLRAVWSLGAARGWADGFEAAIAQARDGVPVAPTLAASLRAHAARLAADPAMRGVFFEGGEPLAAGRTLRQPALAASLEALADGGPDAFYRGELGASVVAALRAAGSVLTPADLAGYAPELADPLRATVGDDELLTAPPNSQGFLLPLILRAVRRAGDRLDPLGPGAGTLAAIFRRAARIRDRCLGDAAAPGGGDTVAVIAADGDGNTVSLIQSLFHSFGAGILDPATGIACHNRGAYFSLDPSSPNAIAPGRRPAHTLMPCTILQRGRPAVVAGTMGGNAQPQILTHVLLRLRLGTGPDGAVGAPRWVVGGTGVDGPRDRVLIEPGVPEPARRALASTGMPCSGVDGVGHAQLITIAADGTIAAASDPRSEGGAIVAYA
jgi:gamma-glutamyltranspeptidase